MIKQEFIADPDAIDVELPAMIEMAAQDNAAPAAANKGASAPCALAVLSELFRALNRHGVRYCHWKSNVRLETALKGQTDLDLLVDRRDSQLLRRIIHEHDVKSVLAAPGKRYPAVEDYLGFDRASGELFHLHVHYQLVLGEQFVKNYRLPLEEHFLDSVQLRHGVKAPSSELELIVLSIRALLKYRDRDAVKDILTIRSPGLPADILNEIEWLRGQTSRDRVAQTAAEIDDIIPAEIVLKFLAAVEDDPRAGYAFLRLRQSLRRALRRYQRYGRTQAMLVYMQELWRRRNSFLKFSPTRGMTPANGGMTLALIGADGAGKSTMVHILATWLAWKMDVHSYYLGSKQPSRRSELLYILFRMARRSHRTLCGWLDERNLASRGMAVLRDSLLCLHHLSIGHDRRRRFRAGRRQAMSGSLVIYDRYPLESINSSAEYRLLDGPQIPSFVAEGRGGLIYALGVAERNLYLDMQPPDYLFVLDVSSDVSLQRKPDHERTTVEAKIRALRDLVAMDDLDTRKISLIHINADLPSDDVLHQLKRKLWELL